MASDQCLFCRGTLRKCEVSPLPYALRPPKTVLLSHNPFPPTPFLVLPVLRGVCTEECRVGKPSRWLALRKIHFFLLPRLQPPGPAQPSPLPTAARGWSPVCVPLGREGAASRGYCQMRGSRLPDAPLWLRRGWSLSEITGALAAARRSGSRVEPEKSGCWRLLPTWSRPAVSTMDSGAVPANASTCTDPLTHPSGCSPAPSPSSWVNFSHLEGNLSDPCGPNRTELGGSDIPCPSAGSPSMITAVIIMALYSIVCVVGLFGNFLVMYVIVR